MAVSFIALGFRDFRGSFVQTQLASVHPASLEKSSIRINFRSFLSTTTLAICPITPVFLENLSRDDYFSVDHLVNKGDVLALLWGRGGGEGGGMDANRQIFEKSTHSAYENERTHTL